MLTKGTIGVSAILIAIGLVAAACGSSAASSTPKTTSSSAAATAMVAANPKLGNILVDARRMTLYVFGADTPGMSNCTGACLQNWPALTATSDKPVAGPGVTGTLGVITRSDGVKQVTLNGMPLYTFFKDTKPGDANGQGVSAFGGVWTAVTLGGSSTSGGTTTPTAAPTPSSPYGY